MQNKKGFTLTEMMIVVLILAGLAAISYPVYTKAMMKARIAEAFSLSEIVREAQQRNLALNGAYFSQFQNSHKTGRTRLIKSNDVDIKNGQLIKGSYSVSIANVNATEGAEAVTNGCIIVKYYKKSSMHADEAPIFTLYTHVEDSIIGCTEADGDNAICGTIPSVETNSINCSTD